MQKDLSRLARELRKETCPQRVFEKVARRVAAETPQPRRLAYAIPLAAVALVLLCCLVLWRRPAGGNDSRHPNLARRQALDRAQTARQTEQTLQFIGSVLLDAGAHSGKVLSDKAVPPLRTGLETARNKIIHSTEL